MNKEKLIQKIKEIQKDKVVIGIDGRCASGKTTLSLFLQKELDANVFHMDDYFLRVEQRTKERFEEPGGNVDRERFLKEIGDYLHTDEDIVYAPFDCKIMMVKDSIRVKQTKYTIIEGAYALHPDLLHLYDLKIFLDSDPSLQLKRLEKRDPDKVKMFVSRWIPFEEKYFNTLKIREKADIILVAR